MQVLDKATAGVYIALYLSGTRWAGAMAMLVWLFALVELTNYFLVRLSYPWSEWLNQVSQWRAPRLVQNLWAAEGTTP